MENPIKIHDFEVSLFFGNTHIETKRNFEGLPRYMYTAVYASV